MENEQTFLVLVDAEGRYLPSAFITRADEAGKIRAQAFWKKLDTGEEIVEVTFTRAKKKEDGK